MEITIALSGKGSSATYKVEKEDAITYNTRLRQFTGAAQPPLYIKLYKTEMGWRSAFEDAQLITELGTAIDKRTIAAL